MLHTVREQEVVKLMVVVILYRWGEGEAKGCQLSNDRNHHFLKGQQEKKKPKTTHTLFGIDLYRRYNGIHVYVCVYVCMYMFGHHGEMLAGGWVVPVLNGIELGVVVAVVVSLAAAAALFIVRRK